jgi:hypothetical protein
MTVVRRSLMGGVHLVAALLVAASAAAQGVGGGIVGTVMDDSQAVLPGVTVNVTGPALMGSRSTVTGNDGTYRLPNLPPGSDYTLLFELPGFGSLKREGIRLDVGFTATINATLSPASLEETVTVSGASPVVDVTASRVSTHLNAEQISTVLVGSRDYAAVMAQVPGVLNTRVDVGGGNATTMQAYRAYGLDGGRGEIEGINSSQFGSQGLLGYSDMEAFDDMAVNTTGNSAETPVSGTFVNVVSKSGGNAYHGSAYVDYQQESFGTTNIDDELIARGLTSSGDVDVRDLNKFDLFRDLSANVGGYIVKDKLWWFGAVRHTQLNRPYPVLIDDIAVTEIPAYTGKLTYNVTQNHKVTGFYTWSNKIFANYGVGERIVTADALIDETYPNATMSFSYEAVLGQSLVMTVRAGHWGDFGDYKGKGASQRYDDAGANRLYGSIPTRFDERDRPQVNGSLTYFKDGWGGTHSFKIGGEFQHEQQTYSTTAFGPGNTILYLNNNRPTQVDVYLVPNETRAVGRTKSLYLTDTWRLNSRLTLNLGYRFDQYTNYVPDQVGPQGYAFPQVEAPTFNLSAPRVGGVFSLTEDQKTLVKASYGVYWDSPGFALANQGNPNPNNNFTRYEWINPNPRYNEDGLPIYEGPQQHGRVISVSGARADFSPAVTYDPELKNQFAHSASVFFEHELGANFGVRTGFVWNGVRNPRTIVNTSQPFEAFDQPFTVPNPGPDGVVGTGDDGAAVTALNLNPLYLGLPVVQVVKNGYVTDSDFYTWEATATRRLSGRWSLLASFSNMWSRQGVTRPSPNELINTVDGRDSFSEWQTRLSSNLQVWKGFELTPMLRAQAGRPYSPTFIARLNYQSNVAIKAAPRGDQRNDDVAVFDIRVAKAFTFGQGKRLRGFLDVYNITNTNAVQDMTVSYGSNFLRPSLISGPRIARVGVRFEF